MPAAIPLDRCILATTNKTCAEINQICTSQLNGCINESQFFSFRVSCPIFSGLGVSVVCYSADSVFDPDDECRFPVEILNTLEVPGLPSHELTLKHCMPIIL